LRFWLFWDVIWRRFEVTDFTGQPVEPILKDGAVQEKSAGPSGMETTGCPETSVTNCQSTFLLNKNNRRTNFPILFCQETLHVSGSSSAHHQEFFTVHFGNVICHHTCMTYAIAEYTVEKF